MATFKLHKKSSKLLNNKGGMLGDTITKNVHILLGSIQELNWDDIGIDIYSGYPNEKALLCGFEEKF